MHKAICCQASAALTMRYLIPSCDHCHALAAVNDAPRAAPGVFITPEDTPLSINLTALVSDVDGDALTFNIVSGPSHGAVSTLDASTPAGIWQYSPSLNYNGADSFVYRVTDERGVFASAPVSLTITAGVLLNLSTIGAGQQQQQPNTTVSFAGTAELHTTHFVSGKRAWLSITHAMQYPEVCTAMCTLLLLRDRRRRLPLAYLG
jgi:hypothetical protein